MFQDTLFNARLKRRGDNIDLVEAAQDGRVVCPDFDPITQVNYAEEEPPPEGQLFVKTKYGQQTCWEATQGTRNFVEDPITKTSWASPRDKAVLEAIPSFFRISNLDNYGPNTKSFLSVTMSRVLEERFQSRETLDSNHTIMIYFSQGFLPVSVFRLEKSDVQSSTWRTWFARTYANNHLEFLTSNQPSLTISDPVITDVFGGIINVEVEIIESNTGQPTGDLPPQAITITNLGGFNQVVRNFFRVLVNDVLFYSFRRFSEPEQPEYIIHATVNVIYITFPPCLGWPHPAIRLSSIPYQQHLWELDMRISEQQLVSMINDPRYKILRSRRDIEPLKFVIRIKLLNTETTEVEPFPSNDLFYGIEDPVTEDEDDVVGDGSAANPIVID